MSHFIAKANRNEISKALYLLPNPQTPNPPSRHDPVLSFRACWEIPKSQCT